MFLLCVIAVRCLSMTERLIGIRPGVGVHGRRRGVRSVLAVRAVGSRGAMRTKGFVAVRGLLGRDTSGRILGVVVRRTTRAAARADDPEESGGEREGGCQPGGCENVLAHASGDVVGFEFLVEERRKNSEECCGCSRCGCGEEERNLYNSLASCFAVGWLDRKGRTYTCNQASHTAAPTTADSKETNNQFKNGSNKCDDVGHKHPLGDTLVRVEGLVQPTGKSAFHARILHTPDFKGVEIEGGLGLGAEVRLELVGSDVARTVAPDTDGVEILEVHLTRGIVHGRVQVSVGDGRVCCTQSGFDFRFGS